MNLREASIEQSRPCANVIGDNYSTIFRFFRGTQPVPSVMFLTQAQPLSTLSILCDLALHHSHFTCHVVLLCDRSLTVYLDTLLRDPAPLPTLAFTEHPTGPFFVSSLHH